MKNIAILLLLFFMYNACSPRNNKEKTENSEKIEYEHISTAEYELEKPKRDPSAVLVLFGGFPEVAEDIKREFKILKKAREHEIAIVFSNYNQKLWFEENELDELANKLQKIFIDNKLPTDNIYFGGFSSGGNVALLAGDYLTENRTFDLTPSGIFIVDSPIELAGLYFSSEKNLKRNFSEVSVQESNWLIQTLSDRFGDPNKDLSNYEKYAVYSSKTGNIDNLRNLKNTKIRMYTEPDTLWWKENRMADYDQLNAYHIAKLSERLTLEGFTKVEFISTKNRGYRANGERHPHSWSIVSTDSLINWILNN
jgi:hypothetical protein